MVIPLFAGAEAETIELSGSPWIVLMDLSVGQARNSASGE